MHSIKRNSSIELLRILSMLIIVIYHYEARNFNLYVVASDRVGEPDLLPQLLTHSIGKLGVPVFVFISGWYGLKYQRKVLGNGRNVHLLCFDFMHWMSVAIWAS